MKYEDTICHKINQCMDEVESAIRTKQFKAQKIARLLVDIRSDAIEMEHCLKVNKTLRATHNIESEYQAMKKEKTSAEVNDIGKIDKINDDNRTREQPKYEMILKDETGKVLYQNSKLFAFLFSAVERIEDVDKDGVIDGTTQVFSVGNDMAVWFAYDQFKQKFAAKFTEIMVKMANTVQHGVFANREMRRKFLRAANGKQAT